MYAQGSFPTFPIVLPDRAEETLTLQASQLSLDDEDEEIPAVNILAFFTL